MRDIVYAGSDPELARMLGLAVADRRDRNVAVEVIAGAYRTATETTGTPMHAALQIMAALEAAGLKVTR